VEDEGMNALAAVRRFTRGRAACILCGFALLALAAAAAAQEEKVPKWRIDPYTKNKPDAIAAAGYVSYGPFPFGAHADKIVTSADVDKRLSYARILWLETKHFRLGINLPDWTVPETPEIKAKIRKELERLQQRLPKVEPKTRSLDPWLRAHLYAQRCEDIYAEFCDLAGVKDEDFPKDPDKLLIGGRYMGQGPYLGMKEKYLVLLVEKEGTFKDWMKEYIGRDSKYGQRWHFKDVGCLIYAVGSECEEGRLKNDTALHCSVAFDVGQNLFDGFRHYSYDLPVWMREGLGHWFERRVNGAFNSFDQDEGSPADMKTLARWEPFCRAMVSSGGKYATFAEAYTWRDFGKLTFNDHVAVWSRIDFMMAQGKEKWRTFLFAVKGRVDAKWLADQADLVGATRDALQKAYGWSVLEFDTRWIEWVKATYPSQ
jgi:hypothetical protein